MGDDEARDLFGRWLALGRADVTVSICYGPMAGRGLAWTVLCAHKSGEEFDRPMLAKSFSHCVEIAEIEANKRGWTVDRGGEHG